MSDLYFNEECYYSEENTCDNKVFRSTIFQPFQFGSEQKKTCGNENHETETKHIHASAADLLHSIGARGNYLSIQLCHMC